MIAKDFHPLFFSDVDSIQSHILSVTERPEAAAQRAEEIDVLVNAIRSNPESGVRLGGELEGCLVRHGGRDQKIHIVFKPVMSRGYVRYPLASFGGQNWSERARERL